MGTVTVRTFVEQDREALIALWQVCGLTRPLNDPGRDIDRKLAVDDSLLIVAERDGTVVGSVVAFYERLGYLDDDVISLGKRLTHDDPT